MIRKQKKLMVLLAALSLVPVSFSPLSESVLAVQQTGQVQRQPMLALGVSLNQQQVQETIQLLGASDVAPQNTLYVDGDLINRYLNFEVDRSVEVYSSAYIQPQPEGSGVQIQIVTPQNITQVSPTTYQNAAITAGTKNAIIKIATITPVTGEGALTGLYALLEKQGVSVNQKDVQVAQNEITVVNTVKEESGLSDEQVNKIVAEIKKEVANQAQHNQEINSTEIVNQVINQVTINGDGNVTISNETKQELEQYAVEFSQTEAAKDKDTLEQLDQSFKADWSSILANEESQMTVEEIQNRQKADFSDESQYHPIIPALYQAFDQSVAAGERVDAIYAHTFIVEKMQPELSEASRTALNELRHLMYQYTATFEDQLRQEAQAQGVELASIKDQWLAKLNAAQAARSSDTNLAELIQLTANATGFAPEVYTYSDFTQEGKIISFTISEDSPLKNTVLGHYQYDLEAGVLSRWDEVTATTAPIAMAYDFSAVYGVGVENLYQGQAIDPAYMLPGYQPVETTTSGEESEQTSLETSPETSVESVEEEGMDPQPEEAPQLPASETPVQDHSQETRSQGPIEGTVEPPVEEAAQ